MLKDDFKHQGLRRQLVQEVQGKGIKDERVLQALMAVPRHLFLDSSFLNYAYEDKAFPIGADQTISQPYTVAFQTELLELSKGMKVLEIGTGSGYQTSVLCEMGVKVYTIERQRALFKITKPRLEKMRYTAKCYFGDGYQGLPSFAPFDRIIVTCGAPFVPEELVKQLTVGGMMVIPVGGDVQTMIRIVRHSETEVEQQVYGEFKFVPMLQKKSSQEL